MSLRISARHKEAIPYDHVIQWPQGLWFSRDRNALFDFDTHHFLLIAFRIASIAVSRPRAFASFDDMLDSFASECMSWSDIGVGLGVSRERVRQVYNRYFAALFPWHKSPGRKRVKVCTRLRRQEARQNATPRGNAALVAALAIDRGLIVEAVISKLGNGRVQGASRYLTINGHQVNARVSRKAFRLPKALVSYYRFPLPGQVPRCAFVVLVAGQMIFVMPRDVFVEWRGNARQSRYIPEHPNTYKLNAHLGQTDWIWQYREAWHLLGTESR